MSLDKGEDEEKKKRENPGYQSYMHRQIVSIRNPKNEKKTEENRNHPSTMHREDWTVKSIRVYSS